MKKTIAPLLLALFFTLGHADKVSKFAYTGSLALMNGKTIEMSPKVVAMSEYVYARTVVDPLTSKDPLSIEFIIDNSASNTSTPTDYNGDRFKITAELIDYIYTKAPESKIGLVFFGSRLWFYKPDNQNLFQSVPTDQYDNGNGCYIPPLDLDKMYSGSVSGFHNGVTSFNKKALTF